MLAAILVAIAVIGATALLSGLVLSLASRRLPGNADLVVEEVNRLLPQTQCAQCGYAGCRPYAEAIVSGDAAINLCPPGGEEMVQRLAALLGQDPEPLLQQGPAVVAVARIEESRCIGCARCREACPVDAITGAHQFMHTVLSAECTGCELCLAPCPVNCIVLVKAA